VSRPASALALIGVLAALPLPAGAASPVVVELFTSEGCSSCPPADALLARLAERKDLLALEMHVDYWNGLGWKDPFSSAAATERQRHYARLLGTGIVYTPQIVVGGHWQAAGSDRQAVEQALAAAAAAGDKVPITVSVADGRARVEIGAARGAASAKVLLIGFDRRHSSAVAAGENSGRRLEHVDVVRGIAAIGEGDGRPGIFEASIPWHCDRVAALLQAADGHILGAAVAN
jgi:hypothetical protein